MTSNQHGPYVRGYTRVTMGGYRRQLHGDVMLIPKASLSSDWSLQLDSMKSESLVIVDQNATVNTFPGLVHTARQAMKAGGT